jgi:hypothetical protein
MPNRDERRSGELDQIKIKVVCGGNPYEISLSDISALDEMDYYKATGQTFMDVFSGKVSSFAIAGLVWVYRRRNMEKRLTFEQVLDEFKLSDLETLVLGDDDEAETNEPADAVAGNGKSPEPSGVPSVPTSQGSPQSTG